MHAVDLVRQSCTTMGCGDRGAGRGREGREQRQAEILPLAPKNTTRTHGLALLRRVRGTYTPRRTGFSSLSALDARHQVFPFLGYFAGWAVDRDAVPATTRERHQDPAQCSAIADHHVRMPPATELIAERQSPQAMCRGRRWWKALVVQLSPCLHLQLLGACMVGGPPRGEPLIHTDCARDATPTSP